MLLAPSGHHTSIKTPRHGSPKLVTMGLSGATTMSSSSTSIIVDNQGQAHDPGYLDALRELHAKIGEAATSTSTKRRQSSSHAPAKPSALGLGLASNMAGIDLSSDSDEDDDDEDQDLDSYASLFEDAKRRDADIHRGMRSPNRYPSAMVSPAATPSAGGHAILSAAGLPDHSTPHRSASSSAGRQPSFALNADLEQEMGTRSRRSSWHARRVGSPHRTSPPSFAGVGHTTASSAGVKSGDDWGFTGIVDVERERNTIARSNVDTGTPRQTAALLEEASRATTAPASPSLVAAASYHRSNKTPPHGDDPSSMGSHSKLRTASSSQGRSKSILKRASSSDVASISSSSVRDGHNTSPSQPSGMLSATTARKSNGSGTNSLGITLRAKSPSMRQKLSGTARKGSSRSRPSSSGSANGTFGGARDSERTRDYMPSDGDRAGLRTIQSGKPFSQDGSPETPWSMASGSADGGSLPLSSRHSLSSLTREQIEANLRQQQDEADFYVGSSRLKQGLDSIKKKGHDAADVSAQSYEFRRRMELFTMGIRFNAFKAKRKLERGFKHHEA